mmetsp:Transcript_40507/g.90033  ORF Transcript_40507/g.90033 Transcript_40507/m.90033 type:complete len:118 (+) Transcript_40507:1417-1770(+)
MTIKASQQDDPAHRRTYQTIRPPSGRHVHGLNCAQQLGFTGLRRRRYRAVMSFNEECVDNLDMLLAGLGAGTFQLLSRCRTLSKHNTGTIIMCTSCSNQPAGGLQECKFKVSSASQL